MSTAVTTTVIAEKPLEHKVKRNIETHVENTHHLVQVFVGNLSFKTSKDTLTAFAEGSGKV